ncbi:hypothetical protein A3Q56_08337 [Intoshia linei]|uniref:Uncharacterized protein n=1 Tax=Intoshia linei TaxID=1819745 RepID=A0A177ARE7_9BILA|nr:hypothetical protein A3Q56_08337 [Intoshia linei]
MFKQRLLCLPNYSRCTSHYCVGDSAPNQTKKHICLNGRMQKIDLAGYNLIFTPSYYEKYCWPKYFHVASNITRDDIKRRNQSIISG